MQELSDRFLSGLAKIHDNKAVHTLDDLLRVVDLHTEEFDMGLESARLNPSHIMATQLLSLLYTTIGVLDEARELSEDGCQLDFKIPLQFQNYVFNLEPPGYIEDAIRLVEEKATQVQDYHLRLDGLHAEASESINFKRFRNPVDGTNNYSDEGVLIMEATVEAPGYHLFSFSSRPSNGSKVVDFTHRTRLGFGSIKDALRYATELKIKGTLLVAKGAAKYPLNETVLPIIADRYEIALNMKHPPV